MTEKEAYRILGLSSKAGMEEIRKRYRQLIVQAHPDAQDSPGAASAWDARELNQAWGLLKKRKSAGGGQAPSGPGRHAGKEENAALWDAPVNENAYTEREVLHYAEDADGSVSGSFCIARGKYLWKTEEDFPLFQLSIYRCSSFLLDGADQMLQAERPAAVRQHFQAELAYLLAQQFMDGTALLQELAEEEPAGAEGSRTFYISSMLESAASSVPLEPGEMLYPSGIRQHRLYVKRRDGREAGYLSFSDDRLYYVIIPLFEQKKVRVRIQNAGRQQANRRRSSGGYHRLHVWIRLPETVRCVAPENLNLQIEALLDRYRHAG